MTWPDYDSWLMILTTSHYHYHRWRCLKLVKHIACITLSKTGSRLASCARRHKAVSWLFTKLLTGLVGQLWVSKTHRRHHITEWSGAAAGSHGNISLHNNHWNHRLTAWRESRPVNGGLRFSQSWRLPPLDKCFVTPRFWFLETSLLVTRHVFVVIASPCIYRDVTLAQSHLRSYFHSRKFYEKGLKPVWGWVMCGVWWYRYQSRDNVQLGLCQ